MQSKTIKTTVEGFDEKFNKWIKSESYSNGDYYIEPIIDKVIQLGLVAKTHGGEKIYGFTFIYQMKETHIG